MKKISLLATLVLLFVAGCSNQSKQQSKEVSNSTSKSISSTSSQLSSSAITSPSSTSSEEPMIENINPQAIANQDYSSIVGTWKNKDGHTLTFTESGLNAEGLDFVGASVTDYGTASGGVYSSDAPGGFILEFIPAGTILPDFTDSESGKVYTDTSDSSKNRLWAGQGLVSRGSEGSFYYKE